MTMTQLYNEYYTILQVDPKDAAMWFFQHNVLTFHQCQSVLAEATPQLQAFKLLTIVSNVDGGQLALDNFAKERRYNFPNYAQFSARRSEKQVIEIQGTHPWDSFREMLKRWTRVECENIRHVWQQALEVLKLQEAYVHLTMLDVCGAKSKEIESNDYSYLLGDEMRIIIDADPGMGKTTYVSKLAYDWATGNKPQLQCFDQIFLVTLRYISNDDLDVAIANLTALDEDLVRQCITSVSLLRKTLVILDGYDELHASQFPKIISVINCETFKHVKMLVTTRRSHTESILNRPLWLRINGFKKKEQNTFVKIQLGANSSSMKHVVSLAPSFKQHLDAPLFLAITCAVVKSGETGIVETKNCLSGPSALLNLMGAYHEILFKRAKRLKRCQYIDGATHFKHLLTAVGWHAINKVFPGEKWVSNLHEYYDIIIQDLKFVNADDVLTAAKEMCLVWHRQRQVYPLGTQKVDEFLFLHKIFEEYLSAVFLANVVNQNEDLLSSIPHLDATSPVSYFLSGMSNTYIRSNLQQAFSKEKCRIPWVAELPASLKDVAKPADCLSWSEVAIMGTGKCVRDMKLTNHIASQLPHFVTQARALLKLTLINLEIDSDISPLFHSTIEELKLDNIKFTGEPFAALQSSLSKQANNDTGPVSGNKSGVNGVCKVNVERLVLNNVNIDFNMVCIFCTIIKELTCEEIKIDQSTSEVLQKSRPASNLTGVMPEYLGIKTVKKKFFFSHSLKQLKLGNARISWSRLAALLVQCEEIGGIQSLSLTNIWDVTATVTLNPTNGENELPKLRALETLKLVGVGSVCARALFELSVDCMKCLEVDTYSFLDLQDVISRVNRLDTLRIMFNAFYKDLSRSSFCSARLIVLDSTNMVRFWSGHTTEAKKTALHLLNLGKFMRLEITGNREDQGGLRELLTIEPPRNYKVFDQWDSTATIGFYKMWTTADMLSTQSH